MYVSVCGCMHVHVCIGTLGSRKRVLDPMELQLQEGVSCLMWVLATELRSSGKAVYTRQPSRQADLLIFLCACHMLWCVSGG